jgi:hypothetical protein
MEFSSDVCSLSTGSCELCEPLPNDNLTVKSEHGDCQLLELWELRLFPRLWLFPKKTKIATSEDSYSIIISLYHN